MFYIYIIYSESADRYYIGHTNDPERRLTEHNSTEDVKFTTKFRPWILLLSFEVSNVRSEAIKMERFIKKQKSRIFIRKLIESKDDPSYLMDLKKKAVG